MRTSYHVHTYISDGRCTISDHVRAAIAAGLDELGISDHYTLIPGKQTIWSMPEDGIADYMRKLESAREEAGDRLVIRLGLEVDYIAESIDKIAETLSSYPFDYAIGSVHFVGDFPVDSKADFWENISHDQRNDVIREYWWLIKRMAETGLFDFAGHLDLYKKFGHKATVDLSAEINAALDAIEAAGMAVELNTAGMHYAGEVYPSRAILQQCHDRGIPSLVTSDAHVSEHLTRGHNYGIAELREVGYTQQATFANRKMTLVDL